ncbi:MAG TPA: hypothetical protein VG982_00735 [Candidatus Paceibacterota bacterium]|jgi:hypothetical protein|nr:hypothetical protein [Candidatus Paceibacterota bacterium]
MSKKVKIFAIVVISLAALIAIGTFLGRKTSSVPTVTSSDLSSTFGAGIASSTTTASNATKGGEFAALLSSINSITIDDSIFSNPAYKALRDHPISVGTDIIGRTNPFAPVGTDVVNNGSVGGSTGTGSTSSTTGTSSSGTTSKTGTTSTGGGTSAGTGGTSSSGGGSATLSLQTLQPGKVTSTTAEFAAQISYTTTDPVAMVFQYGPTDTFGSATTPMSVSKIGTVVQTVTGLTPNTLYYVQAVAVAGSNTVTSNTMTFSTTTPVGQ